MPLFDIIFVSLFVAGWAMTGVVPWLAFSVATKGNAGLGWLPLSMAIAVVAGLLVPFLGFTDGKGIVLSFVAALIVPAAFMAARRFARPALREASARHATAHGNGD